MSESESETDSDNEKNIVVRHLGVRDPLRNTVTLAGEMRDTKPPSRDIAPPNIVHVNPTSIVRTSSDDSTSSNISIREEDVHILLRSIPEYKQYDTADSRRNDSYLRSALRSMPESLLDYSDEYGNTLLLIAAQYSCFDLVKLLLKRGASPHVINTSGASCLHFACYRDSLSIPIVELLLEHNVSVNIAETLYGCTPLHYAASTGELALCQLLIQRGAYIHAHDFDNCSSIDYAVDAGMMEVADYLTREMSASHTAQPAVSAQSVVSSHLHTENTVSPLSKWAKEEVQSSNNGSVMQTLHTNSAKERFGADSTLSASEKTPTNLATPQRMIINTNSNSWDEYDAAITPFTPFQQSTIGGTSSRPAGHSRPPLPATHTPSQSTSSPVPAKSSPIVAGSPVSPAGGVSQSSSHHSSPDNHSVHSVQSVRSTHSTPSTYSVHSAPPSSSYQADTSTPGHGSASANSSKRYQPISPSPYKALPLSPTPQAHSSINGNTSNKQSFFRDEKNSNKNHDCEAPPLPSPSNMHLVEDSNYSNIDNITDLSSEKFELYIERAKFNAKLAKERELHKSIISQKDGKILSMQSEINSMKRAMGNYKEEIHALNAKLDLMQLPFIEATNTLQDELQTLRRENNALKERLQTSQSSKSGSSSNK